MSPSQENQPARLRFTVLSVILHILLIATIITGLEFSDYQPVTGPPVKIIQAVVIQNPQTASAVRLPKVEKQEEDEFIKKAEESEHKHQDELKQQQQEEAAKQQKQQEAKRKQAEQAAAQRKAEQVEKLKAQADAKKKAVEQARLKKETEDRQKAEAAEEAKQQAEEEKLQQTEEQKRKKATEEAKKRMLAEEKAQREATEKTIREARQHEMQEALEAEQQERDAATSAARQKELSSLVAAYTSAIKRRVQGNWAIPSSAPPDYTCKVRVIQDKTGHVTGVKITSSCGSAVLDDSLERAILKSDPLPLAPDPDVFDSELELCFSPNPGNCR